MLEIQRNTIWPQLSTIYSSVCLSVFLFIDLPVYLPTCLPPNLLPTYLVVLLSVIHLISDWPSVCLSIKQLPLYLFNCLPRGYFRSVWEQVYWFWINRIWAPKLQGRKKENLWTAISSLLFRFHQNFRIYFLSDYKFKKSWDWDKIDLFLDNPKLENVERVLVPKPPNSIKIYLACYCHPNYFSKIAPAVCLSMSTYLPTNLPTYLPTYLLT